MGFFRTKDPKTGEPRLGAGVYLIVCAAMIIAAVGYFALKDSNAGIPKAEEGPKGPTNKSAVASIAAAAQSHSTEVSLTEDEAVAEEVKSDRDIQYATEEKEEVKEEDPLIDPALGTLDILRQNQERAIKEKEEAVAKARAEAEARAAAEIASLKAKNAKATISTSSSTDTRANVAADGEAEEIRIDPKELIVFNSTRDVQKPVSVKVAAPTGFETKRFLPRGHMFPVYFLTTVQTVGQQDMVVLGVAENVIFQHKVQIPIGTRLLGTAAATNFEDRIAINIDTILYPDGRELPISAFLKDASDLSVGVRGYYIPQPLRIQMVPYVNEFMASWLDAVVERSSSSSATFDVTGDSLEGTADLIRDQAERIQERLDRRYPEKIVIPIGTKAFVQIRSALDLTLASINGSANNDQPILPGFENNVIRPNGMVERVANEDLRASNQSVNSTTAAAQSLSPQVSPLDALAAQRGATLEQWQADLADAAPVAARLSDWLQAQDPARDFQRCL